MKWNAKWIWSADEPASSINLRSLARKQFTLSQFRRAELFITADTRYRLLINGRWVNDGPARCFPWKYSYDKIDAARFLQPGKNVIAVIIQHHGEGTFQSLVVRPGLLVQLHVDGKTISSDNAWKMRIDPTYNRRSPRVSCQLPHEEHTDARKEPVGWTNIDYDDSTWPSAKIVSTVEKGPWKKLTPRDIPLLDMERIAPMRIVSRRTVRSPNLAETINLDRVFHPNSPQTGIRAFNGAVLTSIESPAAQTVQLLKFHGLRPKKYFINGKRVKDPLTLRLKKGSNTAFAVFEGASGDNEFQILIDAPRKVFLKNPIGRGTWSVAGPFVPADPNWENKLYVGIQTPKGRPSFDPENSEWVKIKHARSLIDLKKQTLLKYFRDPPDMARVGPDVQALTIHPLPGKNDREIVYDFGRELNAYFELEFTTPRPLIIDAATFEAIDNDLPQYTNNCRTGFRYVARPGHQKFTTFRHYGTRYLALTFRGVTKLNELPKITALFVHHAIEHRGRFRSADPLLNQIWETGKHTLLCCMEDTFTDCPAYEQALWVGDARNEALICHAAFGQYDLTRRCVKLPAQSLKHNDLTVCQVPSGWDHIMPTWSFLWVQMVWEHFYHGNDLETLKEIYPAVAKMLNACLEKYLDPKTGLFSIAAGNMFDWTPMDIGCKLTTHNNIFLVAALKTAARMAEALHVKNPWPTPAKFLTRRVNQFLWSEKRGAYIDGSHNDGIQSTTVSRPTNTIALLYHIAPPARAEMILPIVLGRRTKKIVPFGSPFAMFYLLEFLAQSGRFELLVKLIREKWGSMLDRGATTFWETFDAPRSRCHAWSAGPTYFLSRYILGIRPLEPGFKTVLFSPRVTALDYATGTMPTPAGNIDLSWRREKSALTLEIEKPESLRHRLRLPRGFQISSETLLPKKIVIHARLK